MVFLQVFENKFSIMFLGLSTLRAYGAFQVMIVFTERDNWIKKNAQKETIKQYLQSLCWYYWLKYIIELYLFIADLILAAIQDHSVVVLDCQVRDTCEVLVITIFIFVYFAIKLMQKLFVGYLCV